MSTRLRPFFPFYGSKWNIARHYPSPGDRPVIEPFAGSAGYSTFYEVRNVTLVDADPIICSVWEYLLRVTPEEIVALPELPNPGDRVDLLGLPQEAEWLIGFWLNRGSATPKKTRTAFSARTDRGQLTWGRRAKERIASQLPALSGWKVIHGEYECAPRCSEAVYFVDPPYAEKGRHYRYSFSNFERLSEWCRMLPGHAVACEGPGAEWLPFEPLGEFKSTRGTAQERVWIGVRA